MRVHTAAAALLVLLAIAVPRAQAQASLNAARELYASAEYDSALTMLDGLRSGDHPFDEQRTIELYRVLCLVATGKDADADASMEALITRNPMYRPTDLPPRVRSTFSEKRKRLLPTAVQNAYQEAKAAFDFKDYATAERGFAAVLEVLDDPDLASAANTSPLADLRTLATGFHELSKRAIVPVAPVAAVAAAPAPVLPEPAPVVPRAPKTYSSEDRNVVPPIVLVQRIPPFPGPIRSAQTGIIDVIIDANGSVESATMFATISPQYDRLALGAARDWQYQPAKLDGVPVKFLKRIQVSLVPDRVARE
jgi:hypothetical protein